MAETAFRGPVVSLGQTLDTTSNVLDGPSMSYQGYALLDPRLNNPAAKDNTWPGSLPAYMIGNVVQVIDQIPSLTTGTSIATGAVATSAVAVSLYTAAIAGVVADTPSVTVGVPIVPSGTTVATTAALAIDFGFMTGTTAANSSTVVVVDSTKVKQGQWLVIGGVGNSAKSVSLVTQVASVVSATSIQISPVAAAALDNTPIAQANLFNPNLPPGTQLGPQTASAFAAAGPYRAGGFGLMFDPVQAVTRALSVVCASIQGGTSAFLVSGWDLYGVPMTELITADGTTTVNGKKGFKYVGSIVPQADGSSAYTFGLASIVGIPLRVDRFASLDRVTMGNNIMATAAGFTSAVTSVATNTTGDVRGALVLNTLGGAIGTANGTSRLSVSVWVPVLNMLNATPSNATSMFGVAQA